MIYKETVTRLVEVAVEKEETIECPPELIKLVNSKDEKFGRNGYLYLGCERKRQGGYTIDRIRSYINHHKEYHEKYGHPCDCPIKISS